MQAEASSKKPRKRAAVVKAKPEPAAVVKAQPEPAAVVTLKKVIAKPDVLMYQGRVVPRKVFHRIVREIASDLRREGQKEHKWEKDAVSALHEESETYLMEMFQRSSHVADAFKKTTLRVLVPP